MGRRVSSLNSARDETDVDQSSWNVYLLELIGDPQRQGTSEILRPREWGELARTRGKGTGHCVHISIPEWNLDGAAKVLSIRPCPPIEHGPGRLVLMKSTTRHSGEMAKLKLVGSDEAIEGTYGHPIFSLDRGLYIPLGELVPGEHVRTAEGWAIVESLARSWGAKTVHNLEIESEHRYFVGPLGIDCHNGGCAAGDVGPVNQLKRQSVGDNLDISHRLARFTEPDAIGSTTLPWNG